MINIYDSKETDFNHNGLAVLDKCIRAEVQEELNGLYELELEYPICSDNSKWEYLIEDNIIKAPTPRGDQLFRIYKTVKNMNTIICYARHIFYDLSYNFLEDVRPTDLTGGDALKYILSNTQYPNNFKCYSDIKERNTAYYIRKNPVQALFGDDKNSFLNRWGGEINRDNFNIFINSPKEINNGVVIAYGKNLIAIEEDIDKSEICTRLMITGLTEKDQIVILPEKYIDSPRINDYPFPKVKHMHFGDIKVDTEKNVTLEDVQKQLREKAHELFAQDHIDIPKFNYRVDFVELRKTKEYKNYKCLETVNLGDVVTVKHNKLRIDIKQKVISYKYDCINNKYINIELNSFKENLSDDFTDLSNSIDEVKESLENSNKQFRSAIEQQDDRITLTVEEINKTNTKIEQTANSITLEVNNKIDKCNSKIEQTEKSITSTVNGQIRDVDGKIKDCNTKIEQNADSINLVVDGGEINGNALVSAINMSDKKIGMRALNIDLDGYVTFRNLERGETRIDGSCIKTGTIDADEIGSRMSKVSDYVVIDGGRTNSVNGIGTKQRGDGKGYLQLISSTGIILDAHNVVDEDMNAFVTEDWVRQYVREQLENWR
ncbi:endopeptidase [Clostridium novyi A str. 4540]|nr:endopeptidase [Clostridium novyi A str. 4540]